MIVALRTAPAAAGTRAALVVEPAAVAPGQVLRVTGVGLPASRDVVVELCGDLGLEGSADCALASAAGGATSPAGDLVVELRAVDPPVPCPCVVQAQVRGEPIPGATTAVAILGAPLGPLVRPNLGGGRPALVAARLRVAGGWQSWFGLGGVAEVFVTVVNPGAAPVDLAAPTVHLGSGQGVLSAVAAQPLGVLAPGARRSVEVAVNLPPLTVGRLRGVVELGVGDGVVDRAIGGLVLPPGLLALGILVLLGLLVGLLRRARRGRCRGPVGSLDVDALLGIWGFGGLPADPPGLPGRPTGDFGTGSGELSTFPVGQVGR